MVTPAPNGGNSLVVVVALVPPYSHSTVLRALGGAVVCKYRPYSSFSVIVSPVKGAALAYYERE